MASRSSEWRRFLPGKLRIKLLAVDRFFRILVPSRAALNVVERRFLFFILTLSLSFSFLSLSLSPQFRALKILIDEGILYLRIVYNFFFLHNTIHLNMFSISIILSSSL